MKLCVFTNLANFVFVCLSARHLVGVRMAQSVRYPMTQTASFSRTRKIRMTRGRKGRDRERRREVKERAPPSLMVLRKIKSPTWKWIQKILQETSEGQLLRCAQVVCQQWTVMETPHRVKERAWRLTARGTVCVMRT